MRNSAGRDAKKSFDSTLTYVDLGEESLDESNDTIVNVETTRHASQDFISLVSHLTRRNP